MKPVVYNTPGGPWTRIAPSLAKGIGCPLVSTTDGLQPNTAGFFWGLLRGSPELIKKSVQSFQPWYYLDHGYFHRGHYHGHYRVTYCDFQQRTIIERPSDRWKKLGITLSPWKTGRNVIVCPPSDHVQRIFGLQGWEARTLETLRAHTDRPIIVRKKTDPSPFVESLRDAHCLVTSSSIAAVESVLSGVPVFIEAISAAGPVGLTDLTKIETPVYPDREPWAHSLAYGQFTRDEMRTGLLWQVMKR